MTPPAGPADRTEHALLIDEIEQLRTALETALEENSLLTEDRDRLRQRMRDVSEELRVADQIVSRQEQRASWMEPAFARQSETEEELRVAFEELQMLTEELELANSGLQQTNQDLDARVEQRTGQLKEINALLTATEASLRAVADLVPELLWRTDGAGRADWFNQRWLSYTGAPVDVALDRGWLDAIHPDDSADTRQHWLQAVHGGQPFEREFRIRGAFGDFRWFLVRAEPLLDDDDVVRCWFAAGTDIHDHRRSIEALQRSELRFRTLIEGIPQLVWRARGAAEWTWSSPQWREYTGQTEGEALGSGWLDAFHPDDRQSAIEGWNGAEGNGHLAIAGRIYHAAENRHRHFQTRALPVRDADDAIIEWLGTSTDVDDLLQLQQEQGVLVAELQHRTRNLMAVVQAVTNRTLKNATSLDQFAERLNDRLSALSRVQGLLSRRDTGTRVPFDTLLREELSAHCDLAAARTEQQIALHGPAGIPLRSATVQTLALALHELTTNAVKYGALSDQQGKLAICWGVRDEGASGPQLWIDWRETQVADVPAQDAPPRGGGYGRELIERALPYQLGARTSYRFQADGVHCTIEVPIIAEPA